MSIASMDYTLNTYLAVTLAPASPYFSAPANLVSAQVVQSAPFQLVYVGNVGALQDTHLYSIPKSQYEQVKDQVYAVLGTLKPNHIRSIDVQVPRQRAKRAGGEL
ncbi:hypothetical protein M407DRAFT_241417 [Tulasnella calospora MUT 4182]|uniref:Uncharacterized protein n=1 Tax=Tulasnella calospora MUT 4182 TaxID=1051891 RepID=A0A0C3QJM0_9AGAM|nr:hypothetical protein M407DRAFT_241417 [Tulasnella calospora MUT 4182]